MGYWLYGTKGSGPEASLQVKLLGLGSAFGSFPK